MGSLLHDKKIDEQNNCQQLVPRGNDVDVSFVVPLDQSINKSFEEQLLQLENTHSVISDNQLHLMENETVNHRELNSNASINGASSDGRKRYCPEELGESTISGE